MVENIYCPPPQPEDHARNEDPIFYEDPDIFVEFEDGVYYQASFDGSEVAIIADYPDLYPFVKVSVRKSFKKGNTSIHNIPSVLDRVPQDRRSASCTQSRVAPKKVASKQGEPSKRKETGSTVEPPPYQRVMTFNRCVDIRPDCHLSPPSYSRKNTR